MFGFIIEFERWKIHANTKVALYGIDTDRQIFDKYLICGRFWPEPILGYRQMNFIDSNE